jgi:riboflavin kinase/FMN adenylyltransferase
VVIEGSNFNFGYGRSGNVDKLTQLGKARGFEVIVADAIEVNVSDAAISVCEHIGICSSSLIRRLLEKGFVRDATAALGKPYRLIGQTVPGRGVGKEIGFPTANISPLNQIVPDEGVYAGTVEIADTAAQACSSTNRLHAVFSIGRAKTFITDHPILIEAHILQAGVEDLTGKWLAMDFIDRIRSQQRFESREQLAEQIAIDCNTANDILKKGKI